jgi:hypothetical protein
VLPSLQLLLQQGPQRAVTAWGAQALAHLTSSQQQKQRVHQAGCLQQLLPLLHTAIDCPATKWAAHAICNLTALPEACAQLASAGQAAPNALVALMQPGNHSSNACTVAATLAVANLVHHGCFSGAAEAGAAAAVAAAVEDAACPEAALQAALTCALQLAGSDGGRWAQGGRGPCCGQQTSHHERLGRSQWQRHQRGVPHGHPEPSTIASPRAGPACAAPPSSSALWRWRPTARMWSACTLRWQSLQSAQRRAAQLRRCWSWASLEPSTPAWRPARSCTCPWRTQRWCCWAASAPAARIWSRCRAQVRQEGRQRLHSMAATRCRQSTAELGQALTVAALPAHAGALQRAAQVLLQCPADSRTSLWARLALCAACRHNGCAQELLGLGFGGVLASLVGRGGGCIQGRGLAAGALAQLAGNAQLACSLCTGDVVQRLVLEVASAAAGLATSAGPSAAAVEAEELEMALQLCGVLSALSVLPSGRAQLAAAAPVLAQVLGVAALPARGQRQELLMQLGCESGALLSQLLRSPDAGPALLRRQPRLAGLLLQLPCCQVTADVQEAAVGALEAAVSRDPAFSSHLR